MERGVAGEHSAVGADPWRRMDGVSSWDALILPPSALHELRQVPALFSERFWAGSGAGSPSSKRGLLILFSGPGGTGKSLAARVLAGDLHLPVIEAGVADFAARTRSESAQLVARLFATAERAGAVLVLDHADVVLDAAAEGDLGGFGAIDIRDLLRRTNAYPGIVVLTAARRATPGTLPRFDRVIEFPFPDAAARAELWRRALPSGLRLPPETIGLVARGFELPGAAIASCCAQAIAEAQADGEPLQPERVASVLERRYGAQSAGGAAAHALAELRRWSGDELWPAAARPEPEAPVQPSWIAPEPPPVHARPRPLYAQPPAVDAPPPVERAEPAEVARAPEIVRPRVEPPVAVPPRAEPPVAVPPRAEPPVAVPPRAEPSPPVPAAARAPAQPARGPSRLRGPVPRRALVVLGLVGAVSAVALGVAVAQGGHTTPSRQTTTAPALALDRAAISGPLQVQYPSSWSSTTAAPVPGLVLQNGFQLSSPSAPSGQLTIGTTDTPSSAPLPGTFVSKTIPGSPAPTVVVLGSNHFYRVVDPRLGAGGEVASVYALPSGAGTVIALCRTASKTFAAACERVLATVQVTVPPPRQTVHPDLAYARSLSAIMTTLNSARASLSHRLASARTPGGQAQLARLLAAAHARAASAVGALHVADASRVNAALASALHQADVAYTALSRAFAAANSDGYSKARGAVAAANSAIAADLAALKRYGYTIR